MRRLILRSCAFSCWVFPCRIERTRSLCSFRLAFLLRDSRHSLIASAISSLWISAIFSLAITVMLDLYCRLLSPLDIVARLLSLTLAGASSFMHLEPSMHGTDDSDPLVASSVSSDPATGDVLRVGPSDGESGRPASFWWLSGPNTAKFDKLTCIRCGGAPLRCLGNFRQLRWIGPPSQYVEPRLDRQIVRGYRSYPTYPAGDNLGRETTE